MRALPAAMAALMASSLSLGCGSSSKQEIAAAVITASAAVAAAAINRAATAECWGQCTNGLICDSSTGMCIEPPETQDPAGEPGEDDGCIQEDDGTVVCPDDPETWATAQPDEPPAPSAPEEPAPGEPLAPEEQTSEVPPVDVPVEQEDLNAPMDPEPSPAPRE
jgi:hypothetical protein